MIGTKTYPFPDSFAAAMALPAREFKSLFGRQVVKGWDDLRQMEAFLRTVERPFWLVELGCGNGVHTHYMVEAFGEGGANRFMAYDLSDEADAVRKQCFRADAPVSFHLCRDVFKNHPFELANRRDESAYKHPPGNRTMILYLDIGPPDLETFAPMLQSGDYIVLHDWEHKDYAPSAGKLIAAGVLDYFERETWERTGAHMGFRRK